MQASTHKEPGTTDYSKRQKRLEISTGQKRGYLCSNYREMANKQALYYGYAELLEAQ